MNLVAGSLAVGALAAGAAARRYRSRVNGPFEPTHYVWSRGMALLCDRHGGIDIVKRQRGGRPALYVDPAAVAGARDGDLVWVRITALPQFVRDVLPTLRARIALITNDEDWSIPSDFDGAREILKSDRILCWFTQNYDGTDHSGKLFPIPIGLDFHTISNGRKWGHWPATPAQQEAELKALVARAPKTKEREPLAHADFHFNKHMRQTSVRAQVQSQLEHSPAVVFQRKKLRRIELWEAKTRYAFVLSPRGVGLDCHRTWESLVLGNIPIVEHSSLDPLFEGLPVVLVDRWEEVSLDNLQRWLDQHGASFEHPEVQERLTNRFWIDRVRSELSSRLAT